MPIGPVEEGLHHPPAGNNYGAPAQYRPEGGWRGPGTEQAEAQAGSAFEKLQSEREAKGVEEDLERDVEEREERKQIRQEERKERKQIRQEEREERKREREREKARGQEESS